MIFSNVQNFYNFLNQQKIMNNNSAFTKLESSQTDKPGGKTKQEKDLYQSVLHKHYQIIQTFLQKINSLYIKNQEFENILNSIQNRLDKIEGNNTNFHYEFRTTHLMMDKRFNTIMTDYANMNEKIKHLRSESPIDLIPMHQLSKKNLLKSSRTAKNIANSNASISPKMVLKLPKENDQNQQKIQSSFSLEENNNILSYEDIRNGSQTCTIIPKMQYQIRFQEPHKKNHNKQMQQNSQNSSAEENAKQLQGYSIQQVQGEISKQIDLFQLKMKKITEEWNEQRIKLKQQFLGPYTDKILANTESKMNQRFREFKQSLCLQQCNLKKEITNVNERIIKDIGVLQYKLLQKVENRFFEKSMNNLSEAISAELTKNQKIFSNKNQTQRAIRFLESKINRLIQQDEILNIKRIDKDESYLRVNKCSSLRRMPRSYSQKNLDYKSHEKPSAIKFAWQDINQKQKKKEVNLKQKQSKDAIKSTQLKKLNWKQFESPNIEPNIQPYKIYKNTKIRKTSISKVIANKKSSYSSFIPEEKVKQKQWKQKVVKILNIGDRKKVKVTFH